jgi:uncharacterized cysteine cluster protein YcgN (CxxCxxCC family)
MFILTRPPRLPAHAAEDPAMSDSCKDKSSQGDPPFWRVKTLDEMTTQEWESLCDGCARCCLVKLEDEDTGEIHFTDLGCTLLDGKTCRCSNYPDRQRKVPDCVKLTPDAVRSLSWLPVTCAYRVLAEGGDLAWWHPLVSGSPDTVHEAGVSVRGRLAASEDDVPTEAWLDHIVRWPNQLPRRARKERG